MEPYQQNELGSTIHGSMYTSIDDDNMVNLSRDDIEGLSVDMDDVLKIQKEVEEKEEEEEEEEDDNDIDVDDSLSDNAYMIVMDSNMDELQSSTHLDAETSVNTSGVASTSKKKKGRGPSRGIATAKALRASGKQKLPVILEVHRGVPVDINSKKFVSELSFLVKKHATLAVTKWAEVHEESKNIIYERMRDTFNFLDSLDVKIMVLRHANKFYRERHTHLHTKHYKVYKTDEERFQNIPRGVSAQEWVFLLDYFKSKDFKEPDKLQLWKLTHTNKGGEWCDQFARSIDEVVSHKIIESYEGDDSIQLTENDAFEQVVGEREHDEARMEREEARKECDTLTRKMARVEDQQQEMREQLNMIMQTFHYMKNGDVMGTTTKSMESTSTTTRRKWLRLVQMVVYKGREDGNQCMAKEKKWSVEELWKLSGASVVCKPPADIDNRAPCLSQMKRFTSGRNSLGDFDWTAEISPVEHRDVRNYYSDEERGESDEEEEEVIIPFSAPMMMIGEGVALQPRKEINLWKRRTMIPPKTLELNTLVKAN
uniref:Uncharacterized protein n=1 Tax=Fagus sylvatica TaxID=28930 RepID=A0A2N9GLH6_FAGSY